MKKSAGLYLSAREASAELAISQATLYAYVSRGLIRSEPSQDSRSHRYRAEDVRTLKERRTPSPEPRGLRSFDADLPVMDSAVATITEDGPIYRGVNCIDLAERDTLEHAATLLWDVTGVDPFEQDNCPVVSDEMRAVADAARGANAIDRTIAVLALAASADPRAFTRADEGRAMLGGRIMRLVVATMLNAKSSAKPLHLQIARVWAPEHKHAADLIRRALVLLADHELNASTFTVRCAASTGLNLYDAVIPGLAAHASLNPKPTVKVRDDTAPVKGATIRGGGKVGHTNAKGLASLKGFKRHALVRVTKAGYMASLFRVP